MQRVLIIFDHVAGALFPTSENELVMYHLIATFYMTMKVENRYKGLPFAIFRAKVSQIRSYKALLHHLAPRIEELAWHDDMYPTMEQEMLSRALRFKTNFVTPAESILLIYCAYKDTWSTLSSQEKHQ